MCTKIDESDSKRSTNSIETSKFGSEIKNNNMTLNNADFSSLQNYDDICIDLIDCNKAKRKKSPLKSMLARMKSCNSPNNNMDTKFKSPNQSPMKNAGVLLNETGVLLANGSFKSQQNQFNCNKLTSTTNGMSM